MDVGLPKVTVPLAGVWFVQRYVTGWDSGSVTVGLRVPVTFGFNVREFVTYELKSLKRYNET